MESKYPATGLTHLGKKSAVVDGSSAWHHTGCSFPCSGEHPARGAGSHMLQSGQTGVCSAGKDTHCPVALLQAFPLHGRGWIHIHWQKVRKSYGKIQFMSNNLFFFLFFLKKKEQADIYLHFLKRGMSVPIVPPSVHSCLESQFYLNCLISVSEGPNKSIYVHFSLITESLWLEKSNC